LATADYSGLVKKTLRKKRILSQGALVEERLRMAINAIESKDSEVAEEIIKRDYEIDEFDFYYDYSQMAEKTESMLADSLDALVNLNVDIAFKVVLADDEVDDTQKEAYGQIKDAIRKNPEHVTYLINLYLISRHLERIADHAPNIAEEVIYLIEGEIIRHGGF